VAQERRPKGSATFLRQLGEMDFEKMMGDDLQSGLGKLKTVLEN